MSFRLFSLFLFGFSVLFFGGFNAYAASELSERLAQAEADLKKARESLHVAHQELGEKTEEIRKLKKALEKSPAARRRKDSAEAVSKLKSELQVATVTIRNLQKEIEGNAAATKRARAATKSDAKVATDGKVDGKKAEAMQVVDRKVEPPRAASATEVFTVEYDLNSAASLEGRESALKWIQAKLKKNPGVKFEIRGKSNDREFKEANRAIAGNRANFLASFLRVSGVPSEVIAKISGDVSSEDGAAGRIVEVIKVP